MKRSVIALVLGLVACVGVMATSATAHPTKVFVCKYVGTPGVNETLQTGQNPISVSVNSIQNFPGIGGSFSDAQGRSYVIAYDTGEGGEPSCPDGQGCEENCNPNPPPPVDTPPAHDCVYTGAGKDGEEGNDDCAVTTTTPPPVVPAPPTDPQVITKIVEKPKIVTRVVYKTKTKVVYKVKYKTKYKTKIVVKYKKKKCGCPPSTVLYRGHCAVPAKG